MKVERNKTLVRYYRSPALSEPDVDNLKERIKKSFPFLSKKLRSIETEYCFYIQLKNDVTQLSKEQRDRLHWLLSETYEPEKTCLESKFTTTPNDPNSKNQSIIEIGPRLHFSTAWSSNAVSICSSCGLSNIDRIERSIRYVFNEIDKNCDTWEELKNFLHDRMTEMEYPEPLESFEDSLVTSKDASSVKYIRIMEEGKDALKKMNDAEGLGFDDWDLDYYTNLFQHRLKRNPSEVEVFDMAQSNSEHSRHWFFGGEMHINQEKQSQTLFEMVKSTLQDEKVKSNSIIAFHDNSSVIQGSKINHLSLSCSISSKNNPMINNKMQMESNIFHPLLTAETHNFPSGVAPFPGAETGIGGRLRDVQATGQGALTLAGISGYSVGNLYLENYNLPWEDKRFSYPLHLASPQQIEIQASNGASDYGNKFGEPVIHGFSRSFGLRLENGERREYVKPIMFSAGIGQLNELHIKKGECEKNYLVIKVGGPAYRIGMGGGAASSRIQKNETANLDYDAVQRGDAEMENKMNRVIRACVELKEKNPIISIHDQGAGGNGNVLKEIVAPMDKSKHLGGAVYHLSFFLLGDPTLTPREIWGAEYQENNALLIHPHNLSIFESICIREKCPFSVVGTVSGDGKIVLINDLKKKNENEKNKNENEKNKNENEKVVDLELDFVLGKMPQKIFKDVDVKTTFSSFILPSDFTIEKGLNRIFRLLSVGSKRFLTSKVDRSVSGLISQQQCVGPLHLPLADVAVVAQSHFPNEYGIYTGIATACGEQPIKGLIDPCAMARLTVGEALTNLMFAKTGPLHEIKCSANWMWAAKMKGEMSQMYAACLSMVKMMKELEISIDGGKDSLSMAVELNDINHKEEEEEEKDKKTKEMIKAPGTLVITLYSFCPDITKTITPDLKGIQGKLLFIDLSNGNQELGGTALSTVYQQMGKQCNDIIDINHLKKAYEITQMWMDQPNFILAGHDRSDGGLITTLCEMSFAGNVGISIHLTCKKKKNKIIEEKEKNLMNKIDENMIKLLFSEGLGFVLQVNEENVDIIQQSYIKEGIVCEIIGNVDNHQFISIFINHELILYKKVNELRDVWESTSFELEKKQCNISCVLQEQKNLKHRSIPSWKLSFIPSISCDRFLLSYPYRMGIIREEGSNGDREMMSAFYMNGFEVYDICMSDFLINENLSLNLFQGLAFVGGFSFGDVLGSAKGWAACIKFHPTLLKQFQHFRFKRKNTFALGVCNGCQLMTLLGWISSHDDDDHDDHDHDDDVLDHLDLDHHLDPIHNNPSKAISFFSTKDSKNQEKKKEDEKKKLNCLLPRFIENISGRYESRFVNVRIEKKTDCIFLKGMEESCLGIWIAHGEGKVYFPNDHLLNDYLDSYLAPIRYVNDQNEITMEYPFNPNGSPYGIAALCSKNGRFLAMMPHPERCFLKWQWPYMSNEWKKNLKASPWMKLFQNAKTFCDDFHVVPHDF